MSYLGGYADAFDFIVSIRVSVSQSNFWSFAISAWWAGNIFLWNASQYHPKEERKKSTTKKFQKCYIANLSKITFPDEHVLCFPWGTLAVIVKAFQEKN